MIRYSLWGCKSIVVLDARAKFWMHARSFGCTHVVLDARAKFWMHVRSFGCMRVILDAREVLNARA